MEFSLFFGKNTVRLALVRAYNQHVTILLQENLSQSNQTCSHSEKHAR